MKLFRRPPSWILGIILAVTGAVGCAPSGSGAAPSQTVVPSNTPTPSPSPNDPSLSFAVLGDFGSGLASQQQIADRMCDWRAKHPYDVVVTTGDNIYPDGARSYFQGNFFAPYDCLLSDGAEFHAALGNHDYVTRQGRDELEEPAFGMPKRNYVLRTGGVRFVFANSNSLDREWLSDALRARALDRWTVVAFHHPVYSTGPHGSTPGYRPWIPQLFRERGVDLVLNGHDHFYMASEDLRRIRYVVTGGGGASLYPCDDAWFVAECRSRNHFLYVVAGPDAIVVRAVPAAGRPFHRFTTTGR